MKKIFSQAVKCFILILFPYWGFSQISIGPERQLFLDYFIVEELKNTRLELHRPIDEGPVIYFEKPWEGPHSTYSTVIKDRELYKAYYRGARYFDKNGNDLETTCIALSTDGIHWTKPELGLFEVEGAKENNVILANEKPITSNFCPFIDKNPQCKPNQKYKAVGGSMASGLIAYTSPDGIRWTKLQEEPVFIKGVFDSQNVVFWSESEEQYVCYFRTWTEAGFKGFRSVGRTTSKDFIHWTEPEKMEFGDTPLEHLYTQQTSPYFRAPQIYIAIGARFMPDRYALTEKQAETLNLLPLKYYEDCSDAIIMTSRGGNVYDRTFMESFIRPGIGIQNWASRSNYPVLNVVQTGETEMSVYVNEDYAQPTSHINRYSLRLDGFASVQAGYDGGELITKPFTFSGKELEINYSTSAAGSIKIEIQDQNGRPIPGYTLDDCQEIIGNEIKRLVSWNKVKAVTPFQGQTVRLRIVMKDADLYSFKFNTD